MPFDKSALLGFLEEVDRELGRRITPVAVGGTAMTLLGVKPSTIDVDFTIPSLYYREFQRALKATPHGFRIDCWRNGMVFSQVPPEDYLKKARTIDAGMRNIALKALHPVDIVVTKVGRLDERDIQDIEACIRKFKLTKDKIARRGKQIQYVGYEENYKANLGYVLKKFFQK